MSRPKVYFTKSIKLYHGTDIQLDIIKANSPNVGTRLSKPRTSIFLTDIKESAALWGIASGLRNNKYKRMFDLKNGKLLLYKENENDIIRILKTMKSYVYEITVDGNKLGRGHTKNIGEYTIDHDVIPENEYVYTYYDVKDDIIFLPKDYLDTMLDDYYYELGNHNLMDVLIYHNIDRKKLILDNLK